MLGSAHDPGIIPRVINGIFQQIQTESKPVKEWKYKVVFSFLEIYNEKVKGKVIYSFFCLVIFIENQS